MRMSFGLASAPGKFQGVMDDLFRNLPWVKCYLDTILIAGSTEKEHWSRVTEVLRRLQRREFAFSSKSVNSWCRNCLILVMSCQKKASRPHQIKYKLFKHCTTHRSQLPSRISRSRKLLRQVSSSVVDRRSTLILFIEDRVVLEMDVGARKRMADH